MNFTIGSLFSGSGGFELAATMCGGTPVFASEIEPYPIAVTRSRFPNMKHLGSVTDINGGEVEPVDIISFGSPCQDLSVAGKRAGLKHEDNGDDETTRSGLFMEAVRIIKEMRKSTNGAYPRFAVWENVPGAFSSNQGEDFRTVCEELIKIVEPSAFMPAVPKNGWPYADCYYGEGWSLAYRVFDAQYWGVPQRRRRIYLVLDLRGECAKEVLFEREGLRGYFAEGRSPWKGIATDAQGCAGANDKEGAIPYTLKIRSGCEGGGKGALIQSDKSATLATNNDQYLFQPIIALEPGIAAMEGGHIYEGVSGTLRANAGDNQMAVAHMVLDDQGGQQITVRTDGKSPTLRAEMHGNVPAVMEPVPIHDQATRFSGKRGDKADGKGNGLGVGNPGDPMNTLTGGDRHAVAYSIDEKLGQTYVWENQVHTLSARDYKQPKTVAYAVGNGQLNQITMAEQANTLDCMHDQQAVMQPYQSVIGALCSTDYKWVQQQQVEQDKLIVEQQNIRYIVRRLTPTECARLQGFADRWATPDRKDDFTDEEYRFWHDVRNTHAAINGKTVKDYTKAQMLKWYNGLYTDSSSYKLWGNGIALPNALYVMQGIADALRLKGACVCQ